MFTWLIVIDSEVTAVPFCGRNLLVLQPFSALHLPGQLGKGVSCGKSGKSAGSLAVSLLDETEILGQSDL